MCGLVLFGGDKGIRTPDLYDANVSLYQLSHIPKYHCIIIHCFIEIKRFFGFLLSGWFFRSSHNAINQRIGREPLLRDLEAR